MLDFLDTIDDPALFPGLIVLDMNMPVLSGRDTLAILKREAKYSSIPVVVFTTSCREKDRAFCQAYGVEMFTKPDSFKGYSRYHSRDTHTYFSWVRSITIRNYQGSVMLA